MCVCPGFTDYSKYPPLIYIQNSKFWYLFHTFAMGTEIDDGDHLGFHVIDDVAKRIPFLLDIKNADAPHC